MCYGALLNGDATDQPLTTLRREERPKALLNGLAAGLIVVAVLLANGASATLAAGATAGAVGLGAVFHQVLLVAAVLTVRAYDRPTRSDSGPT